METNFAARVWQTLSRVDCSGRVKEKGRLAYLPWSRAWSILMEEFPESYFEVLDPVVQIDGTVSVAVRVTVADGELSSPRTMWLPVMDHKNAAVANPDARKLSDSTMRCLVKCLALHGLGIALWSNETLVDDADDEPAGDYEKWLSAIDDAPDDSTLSDIGGELAKAQMPAADKAKLRAAFAARRHAIAARAA